MSPPSVLWDEVQIGWTGHSHFVPTLISISLLPFFTPSTLISSLKRWEIWRSGDHQSPVHHVVSSFISCCSIWLTSTSLILQCVMSFPVYDFSDPLSSRILPSLHFLSIIFVLQLKHGSLWVIILYFSTMLKCSFLKGKAQSLTSWYVQCKTQSLDQRTMDK